MMKTDDYNDQSVTEEKLKDGAITTRKIADGSVTKDKLDSSIRQEINDSVTASNEATEKAKEATAKADQATENAKQATVAATAAKEAADTATQLATTATTASVQATEQAKAATTKAEEATAKANEAAQKADDSREQTEQTLGTMQEVIDKTAIKDEEGTLVETPFRYIQNEEFIFAKVDAEDKLLFGIQWDGTPVFGKTSAVEDRLQSQVTLLAERVATIMGDEDTTNVIDTMNELKKFFAEIENTETLTNILANLNSLNTKFGEDIKNLQDTKVDKEEGKSLIEDEVKEYFKVIENEEFIKAIVDSEDRVLFGFRRDTGKPYYPLNEMYHVEQNEEFFALWLDAANHVLLGIRRDGEIIGEIHAVNALKQVVSALREKIDTIDTSLKELLDVFSLQENPKYMAVETDAEGKLLGYTAADGSHYLHKIKSETIPEEFEHADIDEYLAVEKDAEGKVLSTTNPDGSHYIHNAKSETIPTEFSHIEDPEGRMEITTDAEGKLLGYRDSEGTRHEEALDVKKYLQGGVEYQLKNFAEKKVLDNKIQELDLKDLNGVKDHSRRNLLDPSKCTPSYNDGENTYSPPNAGYILSNPIECKAGDIFTRTGTATGMVVVSDKDDKNARRLMPNGQLPGSTLKIPSDWTWASFIRFAVQKSALSDLIISKGTYTISKEESGNFCTIDNLKIQAFNLSNDVAYIKATDGKYFELYIDAVDNYSIKARQVDITVIQPNNLPSDWVSFTYSGTFNGLFDRFVLCNNKYLFELKETGVTKLASIGNNTYMYHNAEHFYDNKGESRYATILRGSKKDDTVGVGFCLFNDKMELIEKDLGFMGNTIDSKLNWIPDSHDFIYIDDGHYLFFFLVSKEVNVPNFGTKTFTSILINEVKKINGIYKVIGSFDASDYPKLFTDIYLEKSKNLHMNTLALDYDNNLIVNFRDANSFIKIRRVEKEDGTVIIGSETKDYNEAVIGRVGGYRNIGYLDSKRVLPNGFSFSDVPTGLEVSSDPIEDWQWYHCHDVKYWGMKEINGKKYPTYTLFDNNYWTSESYGDSAIQNPRNNYMNNPKCNGWSYESANGNDEDYKAKTVSRIIQISIDWDNSKIVDYKIYEIPEYFSQEMCGATMLNEGILAIAFSYMGVWGVYDFISELGTTTIQTDKIYKGAKKLFEAKYDTLRYCYRSNIYKLK